MTTTLKLLPFKKYTLRLGLVLYVALPLFVTSAIAGYLGLRALEASIEARMQEEIESGCLLAGR